MASFYRFTASLVDSPLLLLSSFKEECLLAEVPISATNDLKLCVWLLVGRLTIY